MSFNRRAVLKGAAAAIVMPAVLRAHDALATSGEMNLATWGDYFDKNTILKDFTDSTGIKVNLTTYGSNEEIENKLRAAGGKGFDVISPSVDTGPNYYKDNLLQPIDEAKFKVDQINPAIYRATITRGATNDGKRFLVPFNWGTEAITYDSTAFNKASGELSYADLYADGLDKKIAARQKSVLVSAAIYLDAAGIEKTDRGMDLYKSEEDCKRVFEATLKFVASKKKNIGAFWNNATEATKAFTDGGCSIGQTWDGTGVALGKVDKKWKYGMPKEGGMAWTDTMGVPSGAANIEQALAFLNYVMSPQVAANFTNSSGYNSCAVGTEAFLSPEAKAAYEMAYPTQGIIDNLWWWPMQTAFFAKLRPEYAEKLTNA
jgi:spermidine/putrescine transport system substrate-binding protein